MIFIKEDSFTSNVVWAQSSHLKLTRAEHNYFKLPFSYQNYQKVYVLISPTYLRVATKSISCCGDNEFALFLIHEIFDRESLLYYISKTWFTDWFYGMRPHNTLHVVTCHILIRKLSRYVNTCNISVFLCVNIKLKFIFVSVDKLHVYKTYIL